MSKYHKGDKFIVEIKEVMNSDNGTLYRSNFKTLTFDDNGLDKLQKCETELSLDECYNKGLEDGRNDAWECAKKIVLDISRGGIPERDMRSMFGEKWTVSDSFTDDLLNMGYTKGYNKAIDEFAELLKGNLIRKYANATLTQQYVALQVTDWCNEIAEQMKAGAE